MASIRRGLAPGAVGDDVAAAAAQRGDHRVEQRQRQHDARAAEEAAARERAPRRDQRGRWPAWVGCWFFMRVGPRSLVEEQVTLHDFVNECPHAVMAGRGALEDLLDLRRGRRTAPARRWRRRRVAGRGCGRVCFSSASSRRLSSRMSRNARPSGSAPLASTGGPGVEGELLAVVADARLAAGRRRARGSGRASRPSRRSSPARSPRGSILAWQAAQVCSVRCLSSCSRMVVAPRVSGSTAGTLGGGGGGGWPRMRSMIHAPRRTGEVVVPLAVTLSTLACVSRPPRGLSAGSGTRRSATPSTGGRP